MIVKNALQVLKSLQSKDHFIVWMYIFLICGDNNIMQPMSHQDINVATADF